MSTTAKETSSSEKLPTPKSGGDIKARDIDAIRKNLAKRSFHVKFDLNATGYQPIENIGIGAYGVVCSAIHKKSNEKVAIKKIPCVFEALDIAKRTYREIKILRHFKHDNIISIREILKPKETYHEFKDIYVVFDLMESDLHRIIYSEQPLTEEHIRYFLYQILRGLKYIHSANVVHRDLKPSNLLVNEDCHVRIGDFGMARGVNSQRDEPSHYMTQYVATRWYRAPEILLSLLEYGTAVDMWSVGCIFAEMLGRKHLFPGKDYLSQVKLVLGLLGTPSDVVIKQCQSDVLRRIIKSLGHRQPMPWTTLFPKASKKALDLLGKMLIINPADRITVQRSLQHPFLSKYHDPDDEPICVPSFEFDFEKELFHMDRTELREVIYKEVMDFHQSRTPTLSFSACLRPAPKAENDSGEASPPLPFKDQLQNYMSNLVQASSSSKKHDASETAAMQPSFQQSSMTSLAASVPAPAATTTNSAQKQTEVFKKPADKVVSKKSPVSVDTASLHLPCGSDVEMLSAQSTTMDVQTPRTPLVEKQETEKEKKPGEKKTTEAKTISEDTKALVKQALLSHRQRTESCGEDDKPRPVTAAQRQREREEKRRKKKDREKMKKTHEKKSVAQDQELSQADKELLARWALMQKAKGQNQADSPQAAATVTSASTGTPPGIYLQQSYPPTPSPPQPVAGFSPPHPTPTSTPPLALPGGGASQEQVALPGQVSGAHQKGQVSQSGITCMLPNQFGAGFQEQGQMTQPGGAADQKPCGQFLEGQVFSLVDASGNTSAMLQITTSQAEALKEALKLQNLSIVQSAPNTGPELQIEQPVFQQAPAQSQLGVRQGMNTLEGKHIPAAQLMAAHPSQSSQTLPDADSSSKSYTHCSVSDQEFSLADTQNVQQNTSQITGNRFSGTDMGSIPCTDSSHPGQDPQDLSEFLDRHCTDPVKAESSAFATNHTPSSVFQSVDTKTVPVKPKMELGQGLFGAGLQGKQLPCQELKAETVTGPSLSSTIPHTKSFFAQQPGVSSDCHVEARPIQTCSTVTSEYQTMHQNTQQPFFLTQNTNVTYTGHMDCVTGLQFGHSGGGDQNSSQFPRLIHSGPSTQMMNPKAPVAQTSFGVPTDYALNGQSHSTQAGTMAQGKDQDLSLGDISQNPHFQTMQTQHNSLAETHHHQQQQPQQHYPSMLQQNISPSHPHSLHGQQGQLPQTALQQAQQQAGGSRAPDLRVSAPPQDASADLLALIKQMSKSGLDSMLPPSLSLTPRGTGGGYGVGMDLDVLMADTLDNSSTRNELSPLSSSLLADWLEMTGNISQADLDALEQDFSMTSPVTMPFSEFHQTNNDESW